jgi:hypothetical protein
VRSTQGAQIATTRLPHSAVGVTPIRLPLLLAGDIEHLETVSQSLLTMGLVLMLLLLLMRRRRVSLIYVLSKYVEATFLPECYAALWRISWEKCTHHLTAFSFEKMTRPADELDARLPTYTVCQPEPWHSYSRVDDPTLGDPWIVAFRNVYKHFRLL